MTTTPVRTTFADLVSAATVGPRNRPVALDRLPAELAGTPAGADPGLDLLAAAAAYTVARRAGGHAHPATEVPTPPQAPTERRPLPSARYLGAFQQLLRQRSDIVNDLLVEALSGLGAGGYRLPPELLPTLLDRAIWNRSLRECLAPVLGETGRHLTELNRAWASLPEQERLDDPALWEYGTLTEREAYLTARRGQDPGAARELLTAEFAGLGAEERARLLAVLDTGLGPDDEPFLEGVLDDRSQRVAQAARGLLAGLPDSAFGQRLLARARVAINYTPDGGFLRRRPGTVEVAEIAAASEDERRALARDGLAPAPGAHAAAGQVHQLLEWIPPDAWATLGFTAQDLARAEWGGAEADARHALATAAVRHGDSALAAALLDAGVVQPGLADLAPTATLLTHWAAAADGPHPARVLSLMPTRWDDEFATGILRFLDRLARSRGVRDTQLLSKIAHVAHTRFPIGEGRAHLDQVRALAALNTPAAAVLLDLATTLELRVALFKEIS